ncbi:hypothetical protein GGR52DRAFT_573100 [Hypoxylon sp. FL1284]|nr:hypothetical protein GGR52DRAFT_573100 [Hypoxylon sp. FL1284]
MAYSRRIPATVDLPWGCTIELDQLGLPARPRIRHEAGAACECVGRQDELLLRQLDRWRTHEAEQLQIDPRCVAATVIRLIDRWDLGTAGWTADLQDGVQAWREELVSKAIPNNPLVRARAKVVKRKHNQHKVKSTDLSREVRAGLEG